MCPKSKMLLYIVILLASCLDLTREENKNGTMFFQNEMIPSEKVTISSKEESLKFESMLPEHPVCPKQCQICNATHVICVNNNFTSIPKTFPQTIEYLDLFNNMLNDIPGGVFNRYKKLRSLNISQNDHIETIHNDSLNGLESLEHLDLQYLSGLKEIAPHSFSTLASLRHLDLRGSYQVGLKQILLRLRSLPMNCTLDYLNLKDVNEVTDFEALSLPILRVLKRLKVKVLILDENRIVSINPGYSKYLVSVKYLSLRRNYLHYDSGFFHSVIDFLLMYNMKVLDIGENSRILPKNKPQSNRTSLLTCLPLPRDIEEIYFKNLQFTFDYILFVNGLCVAQPNKLRILDLTGTSFWGYGKPVKGLNALTYLSFQQAKVKLLDPETFNCIYFPAMETLLLGDLDLTPTFGRTNKHSLIFQNCSKMVTIDLANTNFSVIPKQAFHDMPRVENINISSNYIMELDIDLKNNLNLKLLNVSFNLVKYLSSDMRHQLDKIANQPEHDLVLDLQHNPLLCGCEQLEFIKWTKSTPVVFHKFDSYLCLYKDTYYKVSTLSVGDFQLQCKMEIIKISSIISGTFLFIIMMCVVLYIKRHRMEYLFLLSRQMARRLIGRTQSKGNRLYKYHGFVCWSSQEDISIIVLIQRKLEMDFGLRLAIGDRDFEVGGYIIDNIVHFITASRKTIIFLSNNYLNSKWCMFELQVAMNKSQEVEFDTVVMILLHDINDLDKTKMPPSLTNYLKRKTYLQWPASSAQQPAFWLRLKYALDFGEIQNDQPLVVNPGENAPLEQNDGSHNIDVREQNDGSHTDVAVDEQSYDENITDREPLLRLN